MKHQLKVMIVASMFVCGVSAVQASSIASEDFEYTGTSLLGQNGGTGWAGAWFGADAALDDSTNLTFAGQPFVGGYVSSLNTSSASSMRQASASAEAVMDWGAETTWYVSFLVSKDNGASTDVTLNYDSNPSHFRGYFRWNSANEVTVGLSTDSASAGTYNYTNTPLFIVLKCEGHAASTNDDVVSVAVFEPGDDPGTEPSVWDAVADTKYSSYAVSYIRMKQNTAAAVAIDAIKFGETYLDVVSSTVTTPPSPSTITAGSLGSGQDVISWTTETGSGYVYNVYYSTNLLDGFLPVQTGLVDTVTSLTNIIDASPVFYKITAE